MESNFFEQHEHSSESCKASVSAVRDALYVLNGKWKLPLIVALTGEPKRFNEIQRSLDGITPKILSKELRDLELNEFVTRSVLPTTPVTVLYQLTPYSHSLGSVVDELRKWGLQHREKVKESMRKPAKTEETTISHCKVLK